MNRLGRLGLFAQACLVTLVLALVWLAIAPLAFRLSGTDGLLAAAVGAGACWLGALLGLAAGLLMSGSTSALYAMLFGMLGRMFVPLAIGLLVHLQVPFLAGSGMIFYLMAFYLVALASETLLVLAHVKVLDLARKSM